MADQLVATAGAADAVSDFAAWMLSEQRRVFLLCQRMLGEADEADSATQDVFFKAYKAMQKQEVPVDDPAKWLTRIAVNTCLDKLRSRRWQFWRKRPNQEDEELILNMAASSTPDAEDQMYAGEIGLRLQTALGSLSDRQRAVFTLRHYEDRALDEIAEILGLDVGTVKAHMARALAKLRLELQDLYASRRR
ncbi:RNA polymerase sigma factor [uncultured Paludibaculum sp.]|uniref:RNA polymerase sigma factor n=1 Tax=uncultured Paludibaculum sp. TaxID=1765020 RepID=UPI002AAB546B|nr:RNA polymerase sigma factor [uncultured Paludibaculum sp.]